jgi:hypothetical protein
MIRTVSVYGRAQDRTSMTIVCLAVGQRVSVDRDSFEFHCRTLSFEDA